MTLDSRQFRSALGSFATGITIVTTRDNAGADVGLTVNSFNSVSLDPPMVLWSLAKKSRSRQAFVEAGHFAVHILAVDQSELATRFASPGDRFAGLVVERGEKGIPLLEGCATRLQCKIVSRHEGGDHDIFVGEVSAFEHFDRQALVFQAGRYAVALEKPERAGGTEEAASGDEVGRNAIAYLLARAYYQLQVGIRPELARRNLSEVEYYILAAVALLSPCTVARVVDMIAVSGYQVTLLDMKRLAQRQLLTLTDGEGVESVLQLTEAGREIVLHVAAVSKATEADAVSDLSYTETEVLKQMLRKIIWKTRLPWQKDALARNPSGVAAK